MPHERWKIHKFGGSSLADAQCFARVGEIIAAMPGGPIGVVVSAMRGMTDKLLHLSQLAENDDGKFSDELAAIGEHYKEVAAGLVTGKVLKQINDAWRRDANDISDVLKAVSVIKSAPERTRDVVAGYGEIWSARLLAAYLEGKLGKQRAGTWIDAREVIRVRHGELGPSVLWEESRAQFANVVDEGFSGVAVITGFIASDEQNLQTTLGRNGSDYSAAIFAALSGADELVIWTDVDGVMSADPNRVPEAQIIDSLSYDEAMELAYFGAKVLHPQTLGPAVENDIPVTIRNTFNPQHPGSRIVGQADGGERIKGITAIGDMALINLEGAGMIGVPGTADRLFAALKGAGVSVTLISQASSEHSICIAVPAKVAAQAKQVISRAFAAELDGGQIQRVEVTPAQSIIAVVGDGMAGTPGVAAKVFGNLGRAGVNVRAIAQGSSERNISAVVDSNDATRALRAVHSGFYLSAKTLSIGLIGCGTVGGTFLDQLHRQAQRLRRDFHLDLRVRGIARSETMLLADRRVELGNWRDAVAGSRTAIEFADFEKHVHPDHLPHAVIIDCTADQAVADRYVGWLERGVHIITPNKKAFSGKMRDYQALRDAARRGNSHCLYETTVCAGLPVIRTTRDLVDTGDRVRSIEGILSGTLAYLFNVYDGSVPFSAILAEARESGYTEPDPRDDLSGMDVARKLTILARELGQSIEIGDFPVQNLIPEALRELPVDDFLRDLARYDEQMLALYRDAQSEHKALRYVARLSDDGKAAVGLEKVSADSPFSNIRSTDNI
ncbi:MAG: bifunctional aspartate kinase/homoserine dehydrogenase I, partial [Woeseiaceae bacterium]|nr:bifunctional aspartate kinase/homoserine dehydrogenase I [Woeseiaceae bacterium]